MASNLRTFWQNTQCAIWCDGGPKKPPPKQRESFLTPPVPWCWKNSSTSVPLFWTAKSGMATGWGLLIAHGWSILNGASNLPSSSSHGSIKRHRHKQRSVDFSSCMLTDSPLLSPRRPLYQHNNNDDDNQDHSTLSSNRLCSLFQWYVDERPRHN